MPGAVIALDQDRPGPSTSAGSPGFARNDLWLSRTVRPRCTTSGNTSFAWTLLDRPPGSSATLSSATSLACAVTPDLSGTYRVQLVTNGGGPGNIQILVFRVRYDTSGVLLNRGWAMPSLGESPGEANYPVPGGDNARGYDEAITFITTDLLPFITYLPFPHDIVFVAGLFTSLLPGSGVTIGNRIVDFSPFPTTISTKTCHVRLAATLGASLAAVVGQVILYNVTNAEAVTGAVLTNSGAAPSAEYMTADLTLGSSSGNLRTDVASQYELRLIRTAGADPEYVSCHNARLIVSYS